MATVRFAKNWKPSKAMGGTTKEQAFVEGLKEEYEKKKKKDSTNKSSKETTQETIQADFNKPQTQQNTFKATTPTKSESSFSATKLSDVVSKDAPSVNIVADAQSNFTKPKIEINKPSTKRNTMEEELSYAETQLSSLSKEDRENLNKILEPTSDHGHINFNFSGSKKNAEEDFKANTGADEETYQKYLQYAREIKNAKDTEYINSKVQESMSGDNELANKLYRGYWNMYDIAMSPLTGLVAAGEGLIGKNRYADKDAPVDTNSAAYTLQNISTTNEEEQSKYLRENGIVNNTVGKLVDKDLGGVDSFLYGTGMSMGKAALSMALGGSIAGGTAATAKGAEALSNAVTLPTFGGSAYASTLKEAQERGLDQGQAQATATVAGAAEMIFEKLSLDHFWDIYKNSGRAAARNVIVNILAQAGIEGSEETFTDIANAIGDMIINGNQSEYETNVQNYIDNGLTEEEARKKAKSDFIKQTSLDFLGGAISGGLFGGVGAGINNYNENRLLKDAYKNEEENKIIATEQVNQTLSDLNNVLKNPIPGTEEQQTNEELNQIEEVYNIETPEEYKTKSDVTIEDALSNISKANNVESLAKAYNQAKASENISSQDMTTVETLLESKKRNLNLSSEDLENVSNPDKAFQTGLRNEEYTPKNTLEQQAYNEGKIRRFEQSDPKTAIARANGRDFTIQNIKNVKGETYVTTNEGDTMPLSEVSFAYNKMQNVYNEASMSPNPQAYIDGYNAGIPLKAYTDTVNNVYNYARLHGANGSFEKAIKNEAYKDKIKESTLRTMYEEGLKDTQTKSKKVTKSGKKAQGKVTDENNRLSKNGRKLMKAISDKLGVDVEIVENQMTVDGKTVNGFFDVDNNKIVLNAEGQNVFKTLIHEVMGEMSEAYSSEKMDELQLAIIDYELERNPKKFNDTVENYRQAYIKHEGSKSYREAADEYVNDILVELFNDEQGMKDFANFISDKQSVKETFLEFIDNIISAIKELMGNNTNSRFKDDIEVMQRLRKMALDTWQTAIDNKLALENTELKQASSLDVRNSLDVDEALINDLDFDLLEEFFGEEHYKEKTFSQKVKVEVDKFAKGYDFVDTGKKTVGYTEDRITQLLNAYASSNPDYAQAYITYMSPVDFLKLTTGYGNRSMKYIEGTSHNLNIEELKDEVQPIFLDIDTETEEVTGHEGRHRMYALYKEGYKSVPVLLFDYSNKYSKEYQKYMELLPQWFGDEDDNIKDTDRIVATDILPFSRGNEELIREQYGEGTQADVRFSIDVDTEGRELTDSQKTFFKNSKIVDEDGRLLTLYHGTPVGGFNEFRNPLNFFTPNRSYAERYANQDSKTGEIYEVYLNVEKPFDITNPKDRQIFIDEYVKGGWSYSIDPSLSDKEIAERIKDGIDWTEADNLKEFLEENDYDYDGLILNEGGDFEYGDRDNSYVIFESRQAKRVDNENPTKDADIRFSLDVPEEESKTLIAIHNLSTDEMMKSLDLGGFPMPSIAITKAELGHNKYGNISVLFGKDTIDPRFIRKNKVYSGDAYTPEFPTVNHKINGNEIVRVRNTVKELVGDLYDAFQNPGLDTDNAEDKLDRSRGSIVDAYGNNEMLEYAFTKAKGKDIELPMKEMALSYKFDNDEIKYIALMFPKEEDIERMNGAYQGYEEALKDGTVDKIIDKLNSFEKKKYKSKKAYDMLHTTELPFADYDSLMNAIYRYHNEGIKNQVDRLALGDNVHKYVNDNYEEYKAWLNNLFDGVIEKAGIRNNKDTFTPSENRRSFEQTHYEYNLANIVKAMREEPETGSGFGGYSFFGSVNREFDSIDDIHSEEDRLQFMEDEKYSELQKEITDELSDIAERISGDYDKYSTMSDIAEAVAKRKTKSGVKNFLSEWYKVSDADVNEIMALAKKAANLPTGYFEAKPQRAVKLSEIERVIVPHLEKDLMAALDEKNIPYTTYKAGDDEARKAAVNSVPEIRFSLEVNDRLEDIKKRADKRYSVNGYDSWVELEDAGVVGNYNKVADDTMAQILDSVNNLFKGQEIGDTSIKTVAKEIKEYTGSTIKSETLEDELKTLFTFMQREDNRLDMNEMFDMFKIVARDVVEKTPSQSVDDGFRDYVKSLRIKLTDTQKEEVAHVFGSYDTFRKNNFGTITLVNDGMTLDELWNEIVDQSNYGLNENTSEGDQPIALIDYLDALKDQPVNNYGANIDELATDTAIRMLEKYYAAEQEALTNKALLDNPSAKKALDDARANMRQADQEFKKQVKEKYDAEVERLTKEKEDAIASSKFFYNRSKNLESQLVNASNVEDKKEIRRLKTELDKKDKALIRAQAQNKAPLTQYLERQNKTKARENVEKTANRLIKMVYNPTKTQSMPEVLRQPVGEFLSGIDFVSHRIKSPESIKALTWQHKMDRLRDAMNEITKENEDMTGLEILIDQDLLADMKSFVQDNMNTPKVSQLSSKELFRLNDIMKRISALVNKSNEAFANAQFKTISDLGQATIQEITNERKKRNYGIGIKNNLYDFFNISNLDPISYFKELGKASNTVLQGLRSGENERTRCLDKAQKYMAEIRKDTGISGKISEKWKQESHTFIISDRYTSKEVTLTTTQIMSLYELLKREEGKVHIESAGFKPDDIIGFAGKVKKQFKPVRARQNELVNIIQTLTPKQKEFADKLQYFLANDCADWGNKTSMDMYGYKKFLDKNYFPMVTDKNTLATSDRTANTNSFYGIINAGFTKNLTPGANNPLVIRDIFDVFTDHVVEMATYSGMAKPVMDAMRWFNYRQREYFATEEGTKNETISVKGAIEEVMGEKGNTYFTNLMQDINGMTPKGYDTGYINFFTGNYKKAAVMANLRVVIQQPTAYLRANAVMNHKYLSKALLDTVHAAKWSDKAKKNSMLALWKSWGFYDNYIGKSMSDIITDQAGFLDKIADVAGIGAQLADDLTWGMLYRATELEVMDTTNLEYDSADFTKEVVKRFEDLCDQTQVVDSVLHRSQIMRSPDTYVKAGTAFMSEPTKSYNMLHRAIMKYANSGDKKDLQEVIKTFAVWMVTAIGTSAASSIIDALRRDDDETPFVDRYMIAWLEGSVDNLNPLKLIPYGTTISSILNGYSNNMATQGIESIINAGENTFKYLNGNGSKTGYGVLKKDAQALSYVTGIPAYNILRDVEAIHNAFTDNWKTSTSNYKYDNVYEDIYNAIKEGNNPLEVLSDSFGKKIGNNEYTPLMKAIEKDDGIVEAVNKLKDAGKEESDIKSHITSKYKPIYLETTNMTEKANLKNTLIKAYMAAGDDREKAVKKIDKWE